MKGSMYPEREHGYPDMGEKPTGRPKAKMITDPEVKKKLEEEGGCPNCGCLEICEVEVPMTHPLLKGGKGIGIYMGCPACPWASPCLTRAIGLKEDAGVRSDA